MFRTKLRVLRSHGIQYIKHLDEAVLPEIFRGRPILFDPEETRAAHVATVPDATTHLAENGDSKRTTDGRIASQAEIPEGETGKTTCFPEKHNNNGNSMPRTYDVIHRELAGLEALCPTGAITAVPFSLDLGRCLFCGECARRAPHLVQFTNDYHMATNDRLALNIIPGTESIKLDPDRVRREITRTFGHALKLREVCAGGEGSTEMELGASMNVNFDFGRYGIDFTASPRHADGLVITGPISANMARALEICYEAVAEPKILIVAGTDAISGGLFANSPAIDRRFLDRVQPDLYLPGNPVHPLTFIHGVMALTGRSFRKTNRKR